MTTKIKTSNKLIFGKFKLQKQIGEGSFGKVYSGINEKTQEPVAIKIEPKSNSLKFLKSEALFLFMLKGVGIPKLKAFGTYKKYNILVESLLGDSLLTILKKFKNKLTLKDSLMIAIQVIERLEYLHSKYLIHRDIKPANLLVGCDDPYIIYLIDFGLCKKYRSTRTGKHVKFSYTNYYNGTASFASINALRGFQISRRDDFESAAYTLIYLMQGFLPWDLIKGKTKFERIKKIFEMKFSTKPEELCKNLPKEMMIFLQYSKSLDFEQEPDYKYCYSLFNNALERNGYSNDLIFSWIQDPEMKERLIYMKDKTDRNIGGKKRRLSPQSQLFNLLLNSSELKKSNQSFKVLDSLNNSKESDNPLNSYKSIINQTSNDILSYKYKNDNIFANKITKSKLNHHKNYRILCLESASNNNSIEKKLSSNTSSNLVQSYVLNSRNKIKKHIRIPLTSTNSNYMNLNKRKIMISTNDSRGTRKGSPKKNLISYTTTDSNNNINSKNNSSLNIVLNNIGRANKDKNPKYIKIVQNNITSRDINMIINSNNLFNIKKNDNKKHITNKKYSKQTIKVDLNDILLKRKLKKLNYGKIFQIKQRLIKNNNSNLNKTNDIAFKTIEKNPMNRIRINERRHLGIVGKILSNNLKDIYSSYMKKSHTINTNNNNRYNQSVRRQRRIQENNLPLNLNSILNLNKSSNSNSNKLRYKNNTDMKNNTKQRIKNVIRLNNNNNKNPIKNNNNSNYNSKSNINPRNNQFNISNNVSYIYKAKKYNSIKKQLEEHLYNLNSDYK